jgi:lipid-A-disaccharide synthase
MTVKKTNPRVMIVAGESSGDLYGGRLAECLKEICPSIRLSGVGGQRMKQNGVELLYDNRDLAVVGVLEVFSHLRDIARAFQLLKRRLKAEKPDLLVLIDYPDFNLFLARIAHKMGIDIVYYVSPQVWAWRPKRVNTIARLVRKIVVLFPFEVPIYEKVGLEAIFAGHPLLDLAKPSQPKKEFLENLGLDPERPVVGILPGSRKKEVENLLPASMRAAAIIAGRRPDVQFLLPVADSLDTGFVKSYLPRHPPVTLVESKAYDVMNAASFLIVASGTATLEAALFAAPMVVVYRVSPLTYCLGRFLVKTDFIGMVNIVAGKKVADELIQGAMTPEAVADCALAVLDDPDNEKRVRKQLRRVRNSLGKNGASERAARIIFDTLVSSQPLKRKRE